VRASAAAIALALGLACGHAARGTDATPARLPPGDHDLSLEHGGRTRSFLVHVPAQAARGEPLPLVLNFHGGGGNAASHRDWSRLDALADREGFVTVHPDGSGRLGRRLLTWNVGSCCGYAARENVDDVGFAAAILDHLAARVALDATRVYATGLSNGAMMAYRLAEALPGRIAAVAPVAGARRPQAVRGPVAILHFHSVDDPRALYAGGLGPPFPMTRSRVLHPAVEDVLADWRAAMQCAAEAETGETLRGAPGAPDAAHTATRIRWSGCRDGAEVVLWRLTGAGHVWPGAPAKYSERLLGPATQVVDANEEMWRFFQRFRKP
jgi:polyhydroxybutyrate depolymerase